MLQLPQLGPYATLLLLFALSGILSYGVTEGLKRLLLWWDETHHEAGWFNVAIRAMAVMVGGGVGYALSFNVLGLVLGLAGGVLNTTIVGVVKARIKEIPLPGASADVAGLSTVTPAQPVMPGVVGGTSATPTLPPMPPEGPTS